MIQSLQLLNRNFSANPIIIFITYLPIIIFIFLGISGCSTEQHADLVLINGRIVTVDESLPDAEALAVTGDTISAIGNTEDIEKLIGENTRVINLDGKLAIPGFIDSHAHFMSLGKSKMSIDLREAKNWDEVVAIVAEAVEKAFPGEWIIGRGWHQEKWDPVPNPDVNGYPVHQVLSSASPLNPVMLTHASGHAIFANARAMELAGVDDSTVDPRGGRIIRDQLGHAIGVFEEEAENLIRNVYNKHLSTRSAEMIKQEKERAIQLAIEECLSKGITTFQDAGSSFEEIDFFKELADSGKLIVRLNVMIYEDIENLKKHITDYRLIGYGDNHLTVRAIKKYIDGALGSRGAWLLQPYSDLPDHYGLNTTPLKELKETAEVAFENGFQMCTHAIGDRGNREILNIYQSIFEQHPDAKDLRWRVEHAQHLSSIDIPRFAQLGVLVAMQGIHCTSDAIFVAKRLGIRRAMEGAYVWRKLIDSGTIISNGTDSPVEDVDPIKNFYASVTRKLADGTEFFPDQKMTRMEALKSYTINGAFASFQEDIKGTIAPGKLADITILSKDILTIPDEEILNTEVVYTIIGGKILFEKE